MMCFKIFLLETAAPDTFDAKMIHLCCHVYYPQVPNFSVLGGCPHGSSDCTLSLCPELPPEVTPTEVTPIEVTPTEVTPTEVTPSNMGTAQTCSCTQQLTTQTG